MQREKERLEITEVIHEGGERRSTVEVGVAERLNTETGRGAALAEVEVNHTVGSSEGIGTAEGDNMGEGVGTCIVVILMLAIEIHYVYKLSFT